MGFDNGAAELLGEAHATVIAIRESLAHPTTAILNQSLPLFEQAADRLQRLHASLRARTTPRHRELAGRALELQKEVARLRVLLDSSAGFHIGWMRRLSTQVAGYTPQGAPPPLAGAQRVLAEG